MRDPLQALAAARRAAEDEPDADSETAPWSLADSSASARQLAEWAIIEPAQADVYSTRRLGRPITALKRLLVRLLGQYLGQISSQQSRFNAHVAAHVMRLEERVQALEEAAGEHDGAAGDRPPR